MSLLPAPFAHRLTPTRVAGGICALVAAGSLLAVPALGQSRVPPAPMTGGSVPLPEEVKQVEVQQKLGNLLPMDTKFIDEEGRPVRLGDYFTGDKPVVIEFAYFDCPLLCPMVVSGIIDAATAAAQGGDWLPGEQYEVLTISINPEDGPVGAQLQQDRVAAQAGTKESPLPESNLREGWHFLTGQAPDIAKAADAAGFGYAKVERTNDFAHGAVIVFASPEGEITRYLPGHVYAEKDFRMALTEASQGKQGTLFDMVLQLCYHYDDQAGTYTADAIMLMKLAGAVTLLTLVGVIGSMFYFEHRRSAAQAGDDLPEGM